MQMDEIELRGLVFFGRHGVNPEETELGQRFSVDLSVWLDLSSAADSDDLNDTVSYSALYKLIRAEVEGTPSKLIEHVAGRILSKVLDHDPRISKARVAVGKISPPLKGSTIGEVYVRLERSRA
ncbi:MAG TPA: dihydroneopterin aldolase [Chloroflexia bacterium]|jgi:dihydroneopterin aldolase